VAELVRGTWDTTPATFAIRLDQREVASGARLQIDVTTRLPALYVDLYQSDGSVRHLLRPAPPPAVTRPHAEWTATPPTGQRLVVAIGRADPLDLGRRPDTERAADYLAALQRAVRPQTTSCIPDANGCTGLFGMVFDVAAPAMDIAMVTVRAAEPAAPKPVQPRPASLRSDRCANIVSRAQLGETLSDAEIAALRTECRS